MHGRPRTTTLHRGARIASSALFAGALLLGTAGPSSAATSVDVQANQPQVAGDPTSNTTATFPTNKQNEPTIAVNPTSNHLIAGSNDEQEQPACGADVRGGDPSDCSFFPG